MSQYCIINLRKSFSLSFLLSFLGIFLFFLFSSYNYYQWPGVWNILTFGYIIQQPLHSKPPNFVQLWIRISWTWIYFLIFNCTVVEADRGFPVIEGNWFRRLKWLSHWSHIQLSEFDRVNAIALGFRHSYCTNSINSSHLVTCDRRDEILVSLHHWGWCDCQKISSKCPCL